MHLKAITLKGFKSFPARTRLEFGPGVSVVVGPNGSGKSNVTDAVLWALGEQSPLAVRGQSMQDVIFAGGHGVQARSEAEVELLLDNSDGELDLPASEISILRRFDRSGDGEYRLNGARCRLIDVIELLSDTGMGKEMHSVISQGRVEAIVTSKPRDRRLLIEEAAGLGKHRKRRRRAQLKLERTQENVDRALDVEREARSRLRPLKRQAEAAELHERLERQTMEARFELARDGLRERAAALAAAEVAARSTRAGRDEVDAALAAVAARREQAERTLAERSSRHDALGRRALSARAASERVALRLDQARALADAIVGRHARRASELAALQAVTGDAVPEPGDRVAELESQLAELERQRTRRLDGELGELESERGRAAEQVVELEQRCGLTAAEREQADRAVEAVREARREAERELDAARRESARIGAELAATAEYLDERGAAVGGAPALDAELEVERGYELALAAALGGRLGAAVVADRAAGAALLDLAGAEGGRTLVAVDEMRDGAPGVPGEPPAPGARPLLGLVRGPQRARAVINRLLGDAWVVDELEAVATSFRGIAVTRAGRVWFGAWGELRQVPGGGRERALEQRNLRDRLVGEAASAADAERDAAVAVATAETEFAAAEEQLDRADAALRDADRLRAEAVERERRAAWLIDQRRAAPEQGDAAIARAQVEGELAAERRIAERALGERERRQQRLDALRAQAQADEQFEPRARRLIGALELLGAGLSAQVSALDDQLGADRTAGDGVAGELRACATEEAELQARLRTCAEAVTTAEVRAQQARDQAEEGRVELETIAARLGFDAVAADQPLTEERTVELYTSIERLARRREQLGPVNPLAADEYREAVAHVEELEEQRTDLETALRELKALIRDIDRQITDSFGQTFEAAARNFEQLVEHVFPGGRGRLRLVHEDAGPRPVIGGQRLAGAAGDADGARDGDGDDDAGAAVEAAGDAELEAEERREHGLGPGDTLGVEIELTPAGKSMKRLSLLSGGEKSMTAIAFLFAVFLARPCPFYILDEVEAALDDLNIDRFLTLLRRYSRDAQFIVVTHQKRTMEAADWLYGISMGNDGVSKVVSRRLPRDDEELDAEGSGSRAAVVEAAVDGAAEAAVDGAVEAAVAPARADAA